MENGGATGSRSVEYDHCANGNAKTLLIVELLPLPLPNNDVDTRDQ